VSVLKIVGMVSRNNILLIGAAILLVSVGGISLFKKGGAVSQTVFRTTDPPPIPPPIVQESQQLTGLKAILGTAQNIFKSTFKTPPKRTDCGGTGQFSCGKINFSPQPRGSRFGIDPFTGRRVALPVGPRGGSKTVAFFGGQEVLNRNLARVTQGNIIRSDLSDFISNITNQIGLLEKPNNVSL